MLEGRVLEGEGRMGGDDAEGEGCTGERVGCLPPMPPMPAWLDLWAGLWLRASCTCMRSACQLQRIRARRCTRGASEAQSRCAVRAVAARRRSASLS